MDIRKDFSETYEILEKLGEGSGGVVYKAYHRRLKQEVVLKKMHSRSISPAVNRQEVDILKKLHHSYLPQVLDFLEMDGDIYTVMSYIPGKSFAQLLQEGRRFTQKELARWGMQVCSALNYLHKQKPPVIHGDIKPANIMLTPEGNICLIDFNIAFYLDETAVLGYTNGYTSPEQYIIALGSKSAQGIPRHTRIDERSDLYSAGAAFYHLATGQKLGDYREKINKKLLIQCTGEAFAEVIGKATKIDPKQRYQTAVEMFRGFENISRKDKRYQRLLRRQMAVRIGLAVLMAGFIVLGGYGIHRMNLEKTRRYNALVEEQIRLRNSGEYEEQEETYMEAVSLLPGALESYYQNTCSLYEQEKYEECISFVEYDICSNEDLDLNQARMADVYYLEADSYFRLGQYRESVRAYEEVFRLGTRKTEYYRDYAIALAYNGEEKAAQEILQEAVDYGLQEDSIYYARGEIEKALGRLDAALLEFRTCIDLTEDNEMKARAYLVMNSIYEEKGSDVTQRTILLEAKEALPVENQMQILESLAGIDIELADKSGNGTYRQEAAQILEDMVAQGWGTYHTYDTLAIVYEKLGDISRAEQTADEMLRLYGEDYNIFMRYAFLEIDKQASKENAGRDYTQFAEYYGKAEQLYEEQRKDNNEDSEMTLLEDVYRQVKEGGWLP